MNETSTEYATRRLLLAEMCRDRLAAELPAARYDREAQEYRWNRETELAWSTLGEAYALSARLQEMDERS